MPCHRYNQIWNGGVKMLVGAIGTGSLPGCRGSPDSIKLDFNPASTYAVVRLTDLLKASKV